MILTIGRIEKLIEAACKDGKFGDDFYFEHAAAISAKLFADRKALLHAAKIAHSRMVAHSPNAILLAAAIEEAEAGYPVDPSEDAPSPDETEP